MLRISEQVQIYGDIFVDDKVAMAIDCQMTEDMDYPMISTTIIRAKDYKTNKERCDGEAAQFTEMCEKLFSEFSEKRKIEIAEWKEANKEELDRISKMGDEMGETTIA